MNTFKSALWFLLVPGSVVGFFPVWIVTRSAATFWPFPAMRLPTGYLLVVAGLCGLIWCFRDFVTRGKGTPVPFFPPEILVTRGLYRLTRNPMYLAVVVALLGEVLLYSSPTLFLYTIALTAALHLWIVYHEEPALIARFGPLFQQYCEAVPRWFPGPSRWLRSRSGSETSR